MTQGQQNLEVLTHLLRRYGACRVGLVERLSEGIYRAELTDGRVVGAFVTNSGQIVSKCMEVEA